MDQCRMGGSKRPPDEAGIRPHPVAITAAQGRLIQLPGRQGAGGGVNGAPTWTLAASNFPVTNVPSLCAVAAIPV